jgi:NADPH-dependent 2,4-dienoyl-CoA reductase/sulfur reductase-like enzyme/nitrite reductase/ring-hydroxylating ferredoxin subunit
MPDDKKSARDLLAGVSLADLEATPLLAGKVGEDDVLLVRGASGVFAIGATCTHSGAPLEKGVIVGDTVRCPWHHACFDAPTGAAIAAPALKPLGRWAVETRGDKVFVIAETPLKPAAARQDGERQDVQRIVIIGAGAAGVAAADALAGLGAGKAVTLIGDEAEKPYDRTMLSKQYLAGKATDEKLPLKLADLAARGVTLRLGETVTAIEPEGKVIRLGDSDPIRFDKLILATGAEPKRLDVPGANLPHVLTLRSAEDARAILARLPDAGRVVIVGSSFIGMEAAAALRGQGIDVTVVSPDEHPFARTLGPDIADAILGLHRDKGTAFRLGRQVERIAASHVLLDDGQTLPADLVLVGIGVAPRVALAEGANLTIDDGIVVDERLRTSWKDIFAVGDIARWPDPHTGRAIRVEHWAVAQRQGQIAALNALGGHHRYDVVPFFWTMHFDFSVRYIGHAGPKAEPVLDGDLSKKDATVVFREGGREVAVATVGRDKASLEAELAMERRVGDRAVTLPPPN